MSEQKGRKYYSVDVLMAMLETVHWLCLFVCFDALRPKSAICQSCQDNILYP